MQPFRHHVFVCDQKKPEGVPCCSAGGAQAVIDALRKEVAARSLFDTVMVTTCGSLGLCENGPNMVVYPEGVWYSHVTAADVPEIVTEHFQNGRQVERLARKDESALKQEIAENRGRALAMMKARDDAGTLPEEVDELLRGYMASRIALTAVELEVFTHLAKAGRPTSAATLAGVMGTDPHATEPLLNALAALRLLSKSNGVYSNTSVAARYLVKGSPDDATTAIRHHRSLWETWSSLTQVVETGKPVPRVHMDVRGEDWTGPFIAAMHRNAALRAPMVVKAAGNDALGRMIDIGGGSGAYAIAFAQAHSGLQAEVFDLPSVLGIAQKHIEAAGVADRVHTRAGDLQRDSFGEGHDLALLSAICHMLGPEENCDLLRRVHDCLAPGGRVIIQDHVMNPDKTGPRAGAIFAINMLVGTVHGSTYSEAEYAEWLRKAGFGDIRRVPMPGPNHLMIARRG